MRPRSVQLLAGALALGACSGRTSEWRAGFVNAPVAAVASQATGRVEAILVRESDRVRKGQLLAKIDAREREVAVTEAEANLERARESLAETEQTLLATTPTARGARADVEKARAVLVEAQLDYDRIEKLVRTGALAQAELDAVRSRLDQARAGVDAALAGRVGTTGHIGAAAAAVANARWAVQGSEAQLELARVQLALAEVLAPFDGVVVVRNLEEGEWAAPGTPVVTVEDLAHRWVRLDVGEADFRGLRLGQPAHVKVIALPDHTLRGHVTEIGAQGDFALDRDVKRGRPDLRTFLVRVTLDDTDASVLPGMTAQVQLLPSAPRPTLRTPQVSQ